MLMRGLMFKRCLLTGLTAGFVSLAAPLAAQQEEARSPFIALSPYAGYMMFGDFLEGPLGASLSNANGPIYGAQLGVHFTDNIALVGNVARASADLEVGVPFLGGLSVGESSAWLYDAGLQLSAPLGGLSSLPITPFLQVGAGAIRHDIENGALKTNATNFAVNAGVGADIELGRAVGLRLMAKDYIGEFDFEEASQLNVEGKRTHNWALSAGLKLGF
jgi:Outer membrane protein beta-barrel domain